VALRISDGRQLWKTYLVEPARQTGKTATGVPTFGPAGVGVWTTPTIDAKRRRLYVGTSGNYAVPATNLSDSIIALDLESGRMAWSKQFTSGDIFSGACPSRAPSCPDGPGPDFDFEAASILVTRTAGGDVLLAGGGTAGTLGGVRMGGLSVPAAGINTATDLKLNVGNDLLMRGGVTPSNSANIGSTTGQLQTVTITAGRDVVVNDSTASVSRIGTVQSTLPTNGTSGDISVSAGRDIRVNGGGEIVTLGKVTAGSCEIFDVAVRVAACPGAGST
jgi:hypothetical protein